MSSCGSWSFLNAVHPLVRRCLMYRSANPPTSDALLSRDFAQCRSRSFAYLSLASWSSLSRAQSAHLSRGLPGSCRPDLPHCTHDHGTRSGPRRGVAALSAFLLDCCLARARCTVSGCLASLRYRRTKCAAGSRSLYSRAQTARHALQLRLRPSFSARFFENIARSNWHRHFPHTFTEPSPSPTAGQGFRKMRAQRLRPAAWALAPWRSQSG